MKFTTELKNIDYLKCAPKSNNPKVVSLHYKVSNSKVPILMQFSYFHWIIDQNISVLRCSERIKPIKFSICTKTWIKKQYFTILLWCCFVSICIFRKFFFLCQFFYSENTNNPTQRCNSVTKIFLFQIKYSLRVSET